MNNKHDKSTKEDDEILPHSKPINNLAFDCTILLRSENIADI